MKGLVRSLGRNKAAAPIVKQTLMVRDLAIEIDGATGIGAGTAVIGDFPEGNILFLGAVVYATVKGPGHAGLTDDWVGDFGVGTVANTGTSITAGEIDIIGSTAIAAATSEISPRTRGISVNGDAGEVHDNTDGSLEINFNVLVDDADISADDIPATLDLDGHIAYIVLGND